MDILNKIINKIINKINPPKADELSSQILYNDLSSKIIFDEFMNLLESPVCRNQMISTIEPSQSDILTYNSVIDIEFIELVNKYKYVYYDKIYCNLNYRNQIAHILYNMSRNNNRFRYFINTFGFLCGIDFLKMIKINSNIKTITKYLGIIYAPSMTRRPSWLNGGWFVTDKPYLYLSQYQLEVVIYLLDNYGIYMYNNIKYNHFNSLNKVILIYGKY